jgi:hypothetical protein
LLIYVFDIESESPEKDFDHFCGMLEADPLFALCHRNSPIADADLRLACYKVLKRIGPLWKESLGSSLFTVSLPGGACGRPIAVGRFPALLEQEE